MTETDARRRLFTFYLVPEFTLLAFSSALEALRLANAAVGFEAYSWRFASEDGRNVRSSCGLDFATHLPLAEERALLGGPLRPSIVVVCGGMNVHSHRSRPAAAWLRECRRRGVALASLCTGSNILAEAGLLDGRRCTIHWENLPDFAERFPAVEVSSGVYEIDGDIYTCAGGSASFDMMLHLIAQDFGEAVVSRICEQALVERVRAPSVRQRLPLRTRLGTSDPTLLAIVEEMQANLADPLALPDLAAKVGVSLRQIERLFRSRDGTITGPLLPRIAAGAGASAAEPVGAADHRSRGGLRLSQRLAFLERLPQGLWLHAKADAPGPARAVTTCRQGSCRCPHGIFPSDFYRSPAGRPHERGRVMSAFPIPSKAKTRGKIR